MLVTKTLFSTVPELYVSMDKLKTLISKLGAVQQVLCSILNKCIEYFLI